MRSVPLQFVLFLSIVSVSCGGHSKTASTEGGTDGGGASDVDSGPSDPSDWTACGEGREHLKLECALLDVPLDYSNPDGPTIQIAAMRRLANDPSNRIGVWQFHVGSPPGNDIAVTQIYPVLGLAAPQIADQFDVIAHNSRGQVANDFTEVQGTALDCVDPAELEKLFLLDLTPDTEEEWTAVSQFFQTFVNGCTSRSADLLPHITSANIARDMEVLRTLHGDASMSFSGLSYGTLPGAYYAALFGDQVRSFLVDGAIPIPGPKNWIDYAAAQSQRLHVTLERFFEWCGCTPECSFHGNQGTGAVRDAYYALAATLDAEPMVGGDGDVLSEHKLHEAVTVSLLFSAPRAWEVLADLLKAAEANDPTLALAAFNRNVGIAKGNSFETEIVLGLNDFGCPENYDLAAFRAHAETLAGVEQYRFVQRAAYCAHWTSVAEEAPALRATNTPPFLVFRSEKDPLLDPTLTDDMVALWTSDSVVVPYVGEGHLAIQSSNCGLGSMFRWVADPSPSAARDSCPADPGEFVFDGCP